MQNSHQNLLFISLDEPISMNLQFKSHDELNEFIKKTGIQQYTVENLKLHSDNILVVDNTTVVVSNTKVCASFVRTLCTDIAVKLAKKSLQVFHCLVLEELGVLPNSSFFCNYYGTGHIKVYTKLV